MQIGNFNMFSNIAETILMPRKYRFLLDFSNIKGILPTTNRMGFQRLMEIATLTLAMTLIRHPNMRRINL